MDRHELATVLEVNPLHSDVRLPAEIYSVSGVLNSNGVGALFLYLVLAFSDVPERIGAMLGTVSTNFDIDGIAGD